MVDFYFYLFIFFASLQEKLHSMNTVLCAEYECRRRMLIKRLDVTVQSFGWSDRAKARLYKDPLHSVYLTLDTSGKEPIESVWEVQSILGT